MRRLNDKTIRFLLLISMALNVLFWGYVIKKVLWKYGQQQAQEALELKRTNKVQPDSISYFVGRNKVFSELPNDSNEIIMLGNSLTHNFEWHEIFKHVNIKNRGINGDITKGVLQRLTEIIESNPKKVFIEIGINDLLHGYSVDKVLNNYIEIIETIRIHSPKTKIYIQNALPTKWTIYGTKNPVIDSVYVLNKKLKDFCVSSDLTHIDLFSKFLLDGGLNPKYDCGDSLHLSGSGYLEWCRLIKDYVYE